MQPLVARYSRSSMLAMVVGALTMSLVCLIFLFVTYAPVVIRVLMFGGLVSFGMAHLMWSYRFLLRAGDQVIKLDDAGFRDSRISPDIIPWSTIKDVVERRDREDQELTGFALVLEDEQAASLRLPPRSWINRTLTGQVGDAPLQIRFGGLDVAPHTTLDAVRTHLAARRLHAQKSSGELDADRPAFSE